MKSLWVRRFFSSILASALVAIAGCGAAGSNTGSSNSNGSSTGSTGVSTPAVSNVQPITVSGGPTAGPPYNEPDIDVPFTSVTVCAPGSTTNCQTINDVLVDTGSSGLRILSSALTLSLPAQSGANGSPVVECAPFVDGITWGPVLTVDLTIAGEQAKSLPIQVIGGSDFSAIPDSCTSYGAPLDDLEDLGANGILGVGNFVQDCGGACTVSGPSNPALYYICPPSGCVVTAESLSDQVQNPVASFASDNNGVIVELPAVTGSEASVTGSLVFGIGTQSNNELGSATVYAIDPSTGNFTTVYDGVTYQDEGFIDSGSNGLYFLTSKVSGIPACPEFSSWYCPSTTMNLSATNQGSNGVSGTVDFVVANAETLTANENNAAANGLAGPFSGSFDWGLPFFFGRNVYAAIEGRSTPQGDGPYWAY